MNGTKAEREARVAAVLIEPLAGLSRRRGISAEDHDRMLGRLAERLAYMSDDNLRGMHDLILRHAGKGVWPAEALIKAWAYDLQLPPPRDCDYARSLIRSAMGRQSREEGWAVELYRIAKRLGPPPNRYVLGQLRDEAATNRRRRLVIRENIEAGRASEQDRAWLAAYHADLAEVDAIQSVAQDGDVA